MLACSADSLLQLGKLAVVAANPEQSKHLATTKTNLLGYTIDFVQLRGGEVYEGDSRIPQQVVSAAAPAFQTRS